MSKGMKVLLDFLPLLVFFVLYKTADIYTATIALVFLSVLSLGIMIYKEKKVPWMMLISTVIIVVMGSITYISRDPQFIKIKPTIAFSLFGLLFLSDLLVKKHFFKKMLADAIKLDDKVSIKASLHWGIFFIACAGLNEFIWRNFSEEFWVNFKVFGFTSISLIFSISYILFLMKRYKLSE